MLLLLKNRGKMKISELAEELNVSRRSIRVYKTELERAGVFIESETGIYGGYALPKENFIPILNLNETELTALLRAKERLKNKKSFLYQADMDRAIEKILSQCKVQNLDHKDYIIYKSIPSIETEKYKNTYFLINEAIEKQVKIKISYKSLNGLSNDRLLHPYELFLYQGFWYIAGYCELRCEIRTFKLNRINTICIKNEQFKIPKNFILEDYISNNSIYKDNEIFVRLKIKAPMSIIISEYIWTTDQKIVQKEKGEIIFEGRFSLSPELRSWILSMGNSAKVLQPLELKDQIEKEIRQMSRIYQ